MIPEVKAGLQNLVSDTAADKVIVVTDTLGTCGQARVVPASGRDRQDDRSETHGTRGGLEFSSSASL